MIVKQPLKNCQPQRIDFDAGVTRGKHQNGKKYLPPTAKVMSQRANNIINTAQNQLSNIFSRARVFHNEKERLEEKTLEIEVCEFGLFQKLQTQLTKGVDGEHANHGVLIASNFGKVIAHIFPYLGPGQSRTDDHIVISNFNKTL
jgi:hypothetical protein